MQFQIKFLHGEKRFKQSLYNEKAPCKSESVAKRPLKSHECKWQAKVKETEGIVRYIESNLKLDALISN